MKALRASRVFDGRTLHGAACHANVTMAALMAVVSALNRRA